MTTEPNFFPSIETERLVVRPLEDGDIDFVHRHFSDPDVSKYLLDSPPLATRTEAEELIAFYQTPRTHGPNRWCIESKINHVVIGSCGFHNWSPRHHRAEIGYDLARDAWGKGYMTEALHAVLLHGFGTMGLNRIEAFVYGDNQRSVRLLKKLVFQEEGVLRDYFKFEGNYYDHGLYALLSRDDHPTSSSSR